MADKVERYMQEMVPELDDLRRKKIFTEEEIRHIVKRRRDFEYALQKAPPRREDFLSYVRYEVALECLRKRRSEALNWKMMSVSDYAGVRRIHSIFRRAVSRFKADKKMWYQRIDFCMRSGSTKALGLVLADAVRFHPKDVPLWLLAADRELQLGHIEGARALMLRALRCVPKSSKLFSELLRLEIGVAVRLLAVKSLGPEEAKEESPDGTKEADSSEQQQDLWAPSALVLQQALKRLGANPKATAEVLTALVARIEEAKAEWTATEGLEKFEEAVAKEVTSRRPGCATHDQAKAWKEIPEDAAVALWSIWWSREVRINGTAAWRSVVDAVVSHAPAEVLQELASSLAEEGQEEALTALAAADQATMTSETALAILEALDEVSSQKETKKGKRKARTAFKELLKRAAEKLPTSLRLGLLALKELTEEEDLGSRAQKLLRTVKNLTAEESVELLELVAPASGTAPPDAAALQVVLRALAQHESPAGLVAAFLAKGKALEGLPGFKKAAEQVRKVATGLWDLPNLKTAVLAAMLECELQELAPSQYQAEAKRLCLRFEELLADLQDGAALEAEEVWLQFAEFAHRANAAGAKGVPSPSDIHWRAMKVVPDQESYAEKATQLTQGLDT